MRYVPVHNEDVKRCESYLFVCDNVRHFSGNYRDELYEVVTVQGEGCKTGVLTQTYLFFCLA